MTLPKPSNNFFSLAVFVSPKSIPDSAHRDMKCISKYLKSKVFFSYLSAKADSVAIPLTALAPLDDLTPNKYLATHKALSLMYVLMLLGDK